jgi:hypothetical protein
MLTTIGADLFAAGPAGAAAPPPPRAPAAHPFAELLRQNQAAEPLAAARARSLAADEAADAPEPGDTPAAPQVQKAKPRLPAAPAPAPRPARGEPGETTRGGAELEPDRPRPVGASGPADAAPAGAPAAPDAATAAWLDLLAKSLETSARAETSGAADDDPALAGAAAEASARTGNGRSDGPERADAAGSVRGGPRASGAGAILADLHRPDPLAGPADPAGAPVGPRQDAKASPLELPSLGAALIATSPAPSGPDAAPAVDVRLATPPDEPGFAQALGVQVSILARDGIQRAELHLNPSDMGPVSVLINVDGTQARVDFGADVAATRQAIESGLPALASALQACGLTLHGGGVSQHSAGRRDTDAPAGNAGATGEAEVEAAALPTHRLALHAGLDVYA